MRIFSNAAIVFLSSCNDVSIKNEEKQILDVLSQMKMSWDENKKQKYPCIILQIPRCSALEEFRFPVSKRSSPIGETIISENKYIREKLYLNGRKEAE